MPPPPHLHTLSLFISQTHTYKHTLSHSFSFLTPPLSINRHTLTHTYKHTLTNTHSCTHKQPIHEDLYNLLPSAIFWGKQINRSLKWVSYLSKYFLVQFFILGFKRKQKWSSYCVASNLIKTFSCCLWLKIVGLNLHSFT